MLEATRDMPSYDVVRGRTRVSADHPLARRYPDAFKEATDGPGDEVRTSGPRPGCDCRLREGSSKRSSTRSRRARLPLAEEVAVRDRTLAEFDTPDRVESTSGRRSRQFWEATAAALDRLDPEGAQRRAREDTEDREQAEVEGVLAAHAQTELDAIDAAWGNAAPWR